MKFELDPVLSERVKVFRGCGEAVEIDRPDGALPVAVCGVSFAEPKQPDSLVPKFKPPVAGAFDIGLLRTSLVGASGHDDYASCRVEYLVAGGFAYWRLDHVHERAIHQENPHAAMPGMPQERDVGAAGPKSVAPVHVGDDRSVECVERLVDVARFASVAIDLAGVEASGETARRDWRRNARMARHAAGSAAPAARAMASSFSPTSGSIPASGTNRASL